MAADRDDNVVSSSVRQATRKARVFRIQTLNEADCAKMFAQQLLSNSSIIDQSIRFTS